VWKFDTNFNKVEEFIEFARRNPGELRMSIAGQATAPHISRLLLKSKIGCKFTKVRGATPLSYLLHKFDKVGPIKNVKRGDCL